MSTPRDRQRRLEAGWDLWLDLSDRQKCEVSAFVWGALMDQCLTRQSIDTEEATRILLRGVERVTAQVKVPGGRPFARPLSEGGLPECEPRTRLYPIVLA